MSTATTTTAGRTTAAETGLAATTVQRRPSRASYTDDSEAHLFRSRLGSLSQQDYTQPIDEEEEQLKHHFDDSKATSDAENSRPPSPPVLATYPPSQAKPAELAAVDQGAAAWRFLACGFVIWSMVWGVAYSYGSFQDYHEHNSDSPLYGTSVTGISAVGTLVIGCQHFIPLILRGFVTTFPHLRRRLVLVSVVLSSACILVASFARSIAMLIVFQGVLFGVTSGVLLLPVVLYLGQWFDTRRGLATGVIFMGSGFGGVVFPLILNALLTSIGFAWTMRVWALAQLVLTGTALWFVNPRLPLETPDVLPITKLELAKALLPGDLSWLTHPLSLIYLGVVALQAFGWYIVSLYIATYATALGFSSTVSTGILAAFNASAIIGYTITGPSIDKLSFTLGMAVSSGLCALAALLLLGFAATLPILLVFAIVFGAAGGGFGCFLTPIARDLAGVTRSDNALQFLTWMFIRGVAAVTGPLVGSALYRPSVVTKDPHAGEYGINGFNALIVFTGASMGVASLVALAAHVFRSKVV
ncbi:hypothetical protein PaG_00192 [Moesziomyces aphidis]|uniref:Major facilitator superfamily (MFS) profile domain-containing protein n=1 Tax=Moesziomyces aphidis TaxID=84754 RepID=W3VUB3_MOEAP|nr:hypothetical protein PaG_00192 [Moesziomyces aphidis]